MAHGCTGKGNDQVRFEHAYQALAPELKVIVPWREWKLQSREDCLDYAEAHGIPVAQSREKIHSRDRNLLHVRHEGGELEDPNNAPLPTTWTWTKSPQDAPDQVEKVTIEFKQGLPVAVNGVELDPVALVEMLNEIGARNAIGRIDLVENRFVGIKSRGCYETPGGTLLLTAHRELEALCLDRELAHFKQHIGLKYAEVVYFGLWFTPLRESLQAFVTSSQNDVNGSVTLALYKGNVDVAGRKSESSLYRPDIASFTMGDKLRPEGCRGLHPHSGLACAHAGDHSRERLRVARRGCGGSSRRRRWNEVKMWSGRFSQALDAEFEQWQRSFPFDRILLPYEVAASKAHARALAKAGVLTGAELSATLAALEQIASRRRAAKSTIRRSKTFIITSRSGWCEIAGEVGYKLHTGRSRNEQIATDLRLYVRDTDRRDCTLLAELAEAIREPGEKRAGDAAMPAYTHLQRAEPVLVAHWLLAYVEMFLRDLERLADCRKRLNVCPLGSGAMAGTILPFDREGDCGAVRVRGSDSEQHGRDQRPRLRHRVRAGVVIRRRCISVDGRRSSFSSATT